ncbi:MAG: TadE/TadG family type IV pilus assembly protein [Actinomycetota bacterium]
MRACRWYRAEEGTATLPLVLAVPAMLALVLGGVQLALWLHLQHVVTAAAQEGLVAARVETGTAVAGEERAWLFLEQLAPPLLKDPSVVATAGPEVARVVVRARVAEVVPGLRLEVRATAEGVRERFRGP